MQKKRDYLKQIYRQNTETGAYLIEVSLDSYSEIFNGWDPSPIKRRDLDPDFLSFVEAGAHDIDDKFPVEIVLSLPKEIYDETREKATEFGIRNNFEFMLHLTRKTIKKNRKRIFMYIFMSIAFLTSSNLARQGIELGFASSLLIEGLFIGGWVFLWEAFSLIFFSGEHTVGRIKTYKRLNDAPLTFTYIEK